MTICNFPLLLRCLAILAVCLLILPAKLDAAAPVNVILDTDLGNDCDDAGALALLHALADRGEVNLLGVTCDTSNPWEAPCVDAIDHFYGRPDIPVGTLKEAGFFDFVNFTRYIAQHYPARIKNGTDAPDATLLFRQILARQPDRSVVVVAIGPLRVLSNLLNSGPDKISPLSGPDLVARKVKLLSDMGGGYPNGKEFNFDTDGAATQNVVQRWPSPIMFSGYEIGSSIYTGSRLFTETTDDNPIRRIYQRYVKYGGSRPSWDLTAALYAVRGLSVWWTAQTGGTVLAAPDGSDSWKAGTGGRHGYLVARMPPEDVAKALEDLVVSAKPGNEGFDWDTTSDQIGTASARGDDGAHPASAAFADDPNARWADTSLPSWIQYEYAASKDYVVSRYAITSAPADPEKDPLDWSLLGSLDGSHWTTLDTQKAQTFSRPGQRRVFSFANARAFHFYRLQIQTVASPAKAGAVQVGKLELLEPIPARHKTSLRR